MSTVSDTKSLTSPCMGTTSFHGSSIGLTRPSSWTKPLESLLPPPFPFAMTPSPPLWNIRLRSIVMRTLPPLVGLLKIPSPLLSLTKTSDSSITAPLPLGVTLIPVVN